MVRAGVVKHPSEYRMSGLNEIQNPQKRYAVVDGTALRDFFAVSDSEKFRQEYRSWVDVELKADAQTRNSLWSESLAVGGKGFVEKIQQQLGVRAKGRSVVLEKEGNVLKETQAPYSTLFEGKKVALRLNNSYLLDINYDISRL